MKNIAKWLWRNLMCYQGKHWLAFDQYAARRVVSCTCCEFWWLAR